MITIDMLLDHHPGRFILLQHGLFRLVNPEALVPGHTVRVRYHPLGIWATVLPAGGPSRGADCSAPGRGRGVAMSRGLLE